MDPDHAIRENIRRLIAERETNPARVALDAGLNRRAVQDILDERAASPKISTVFKIAKALDCPPAELMGLSGPRLAPELVEFLRQYDESAQVQLVKALASLPRFQGEGQ